MKLTVRTALGEERTITLRDKELTVGRSEGCTIRIGSARVSRRHCRIWRDHLGWQVEDLGSRNGTRVNDFRIDFPVLLSPGDRIEVGSVELTIGDCMNSHFSISSKVKDETLSEKAYPATNGQQRSIICTPGLPQGCSNVRSSTSGGTSLAVRKSGWWRMGAKKKSSHPVRRLPVELKARFADPATAARDSLKRRFHIGS